MYAGLLIFSYLYVVLNETLSLVIKVTVLLTSSSPSHETEWSSTSSLPFAQNASRRVVVTACVDGRVGLGIGFWQEGEGALDEELLGFFCCQRSGRGSRGSLRLRFRFRFVAGL
jgi:hypothetical protein